MRALQLTVDEFDKSVKPGGLLYSAVKAGLDPEILIDHQNKKVVVALDDAMEQLLTSYTVAPKAG
jgi:hypothetical protein